MRERITITLDHAIAARVKRAAASSPGGVSGYIERVIDEHERRAVVRSTARWYAANPEYVAADVAEAEAAEAETTRLGR
jgi:hypothetical protein